MNEQIDQLLRLALSEDIGSGDHSSLAVLPPDRQGEAMLIAKESGILAGIRIVSRLISLFDPTLQSTVYLHDGDLIKAGDQLMMLEGSSLSILQIERLMLNILQRMSGIATQTAAFVNQIKGTGAKILDTRKTSPNLRILEKEAVRIGGGENHRMGLYDMIMLKDNHIDFAGGIREAIHLCHKYLDSRQLNLAIEIEVRNFNELNEVLACGAVDRIMLDNFTVKDTLKAVSMVKGKFELESSGGITLESIRAYAEAGVDYISVGALTHQIKSLDLSLNARI